MEPNTDNSANQQPPAPVEPVTPAAPAPSPTPVSTASSTTPVSPKKNKTGAIVGIVVGLLAILLGLALAWMFIFSPAAQAKKTSTEFMKAAAAGDTAKLYTIANAQTAAEKAFLDSAAKNTEGTFTLKDKTMQGDKGYFLYDLSNEKGKMGRTTVEKKDGKWVVSGYVFGSDNLALIPGSSTEVATEETADEPATTTAACLTKADFSAYGATPFFIKDDPITYRTTVFFNADATTYKSANSSSTFYAQSKAFATQNAGKQYTYKLTGVVMGTNQTADEQKLSNDRAAVVKKDLIAAGVPEANIEITAPSTDTTAERDANRAVDVNLVAACTSTAAPATGL
ncbi:MAG: hypothetical protein ABIQ89_00620 [Candidatus Saccharimonadales bacterium]